MYFHSIHPVVGLGAIAAFDKGVQRVLRTWGVGADQVGEGDLVVGSVSHHVAAGYVTEELGSH